MRALLVIILLAMCSCKKGDVPRNALDDARRLADRGDYEGALAKHVWFHDNALKLDPSYYGVRLSFALAAWVDLGKKYPKALETLKSIRDGKTSRIIAGDTTHELFHDVESINDYLNESAATAALFKQIEKTDPVFAARVYHITELALVENGEFTLAKKYLGDPSKSLDGAKRSFQQGMDYAKTSGEGDSSRRAYERIFADHVVRILTILRKTGDKAGAMAIHAEALKTLDNAEIRDALKE